MPIGAHNAIKTRCPHGHPYDEENTYLSPSKRRHCRTCAIKRHEMRLAKNPREERRKQVERTLKWQSKNPDKMRLYDKRRRHRKKLKKYDMTPESYAVLLEKQGGVCAICLGVCSMGRRLSVDHDHSTGKVRGLLCGGCNVGIGRFKDDPALLRAAITYLAKSPLS